VQILAPAQLTDAELKLIAEAQVREQAQQLQADQQAKIRAQVAALLKVSLLEFEHVHLYIYLLI
jgi:hypothetical protein